MSCLGKVLSWISSVSLVLLLLNYSSYPLHNPGTWALIIFCAVSGTLGMIFSRASKGNEQIRRDEEAELILEHLAKRIHRDFILYLRPFSRDHEMQQANPNSSNYRIFPTYFTEAAQKSLESVLRDSIGDEIPMLSLGERWQNFGAARIETSDDSWQSIFVLLASRAKMILVVPSASSEGCLEELRFIRKAGFLAKTIFIQPPEGISKGINQETWDLSREKLSLEGFVLGDFRTDGSLSTLKPTGELDKHLFLPKTLDSSIFHLGLTLLEKDLPISWPDDSTMKKVKSDWERKFLRRQNE